MSTTSESSAAEVIHASLDEPQLDTLRDSVYSRSPDSSQHAAAVTTRLRLMLARAELLSAVAESDGGKAGGAEQLRGAVEALRSLEPSDAETQVDMAVAELLADPSPTAVDRISEAVDAVAAGEVSPNALVCLADRLFDEDRRSQSLALISLIVNRLSQAMSASDSPGTLASGGVAVAEGVAQAKPETMSRSPRRLLKGMLKLLKQRLDAVPGDQELRVLLAGALVASGSFDQAREAADEALRRDGADANARLIRAIACAQLGQHGEALADIEGLPESVLSAPYMRLVRIQLLAALGRYGEALALADAEISSDAGGIEIAVWRAQVLAEAGRSDEALTALEELCGQHPERPDLLRFWAELLRGAGRVEEAIAALKAFNGKDPTDVEALKQLAELYTQCGNNDAALVELDRALSLAPGRVDLLLPRASALHGAGRDIAALQSAEQAMQLDTADHQAAGLMGQILDELGRREEAATAYVEAFTRARVTHAELAANYVANVERIVDLLAETEVFDAALRVTDRLRAATPLTGRVAGVRAELLRVMGRYRDAVNQADEAVDSGTDRVWMAGTKGASLIELGRSARALSVIEDALQQSPDYGFGRGIQLRALNQVGRVTDALQVLDAHLSSGEDAEPFATMARTALWNNLGRFAESLRLLEQRVEESRAQDTEVAPDWLVRLGNAYHRLGMIDDAVDNLGRAVEATGPDVQPWALIELADALMRTPRADEAKPFYELAIASSAGQERLLALTESGWALFRLGQIEPTLERFGLALQQSEDPMFFERTRYALINLLVREDVAAETELDELLRRIAGLEDRAYAGGVLADGRHVCAMLRADGTWAHRVDRVAMAESRFQIVDG